MRGGADKAAADPRLRREDQAVRVVVYIGDVFEESLPHGRQLADQLGARGTKLFVLHDTSDASARRDAEVFWDLAKRTGGCVLPFNSSAPGRLRDLLSAVAVYAVGARSCCGKDSARCRARWRCWSTSTDGGDARTGHCRQSSARLWNLSRHRAGADRRDDRGDDDGAAAISRIRADWPRLVA